MVHRVDAVLGAAGSFPAVTAGFAAVAALALGGMLTYAIPLAALLGYAWLTSRQKRQRHAATVDSETLALAEAILERIDAGMPLANAIGSGIDAACPFGEDVRAALLRYRQSGGATAFRSMDAGGSARLPKLASILASALKSGADASPMLASLCEDFRREDSYRLRSLGSTGNYVTVMRMGTAVFFPMFAGVSINIIGFAHSSITGAASASMQLVGVFAAYSVAANYVGMGPRASLKDRISGAAFFGGIAIMVMEAALALSGRMVW